MAEKNVRKKKLDAIATKIALYMVQETYTDEQDAQQLLNDALVLLDKAAAILVASDEKNYPAA
jgi:DNA-binding phage protein